MVKKFTVHIRTKLKCALILSFVNEYLVVSFPTTKAKNRFTPRKILTTWYLDRKRALRFEYETEHKYVFWQ